MRFAVAVVRPPSNPTIGGGFREIAEALHHGLVALGHDSVLTNRLDLDDRRTIVLGGNHLVQYGLDVPTNPIFYNLEQLGDDSPWMTMPEFVDLFRHYPHWDYSHANIERLAAMGLPRPTYVPIGYVPELTRIAPAPEDIDVLFYGMLSERRYAVLRELRDRGVRVKWLSGALGASRDAWIARSKIVLNMHYWDAKIFEIARVSYLLIAVLEAEPTVFQVGINFADADELTGICADEQDVSRSPDAGRYVLTEAVATGPAMFDTTLLDRAGGIGGSDPDPLAELGWRAVAVGLGTASLDEVLCIAAARPVKQPKAPAPASKKGKGRRPKKPSK